MKSSGAGITAVTTKLSDDNHPTWSPTSKALAFVSDRTGSTEIYAYTFTTGSLKQLTFDEAFKSNPRLAAGEADRGDSSQPNACLSTRAHSHLSPAPTPGRRVAHRLTGMPGPQEGPLRRVLLACGLR